MLRISPAIPMKRSPRRYICRETKAVLTAPAAGCCRWLGRVRAQYSHNAGHQRPHRCPWRDIPAYTGSPYIALNGNQPEFEEGDLSTESFETYSPLDSLGRCGPAYACIGQGPDAHGGTGKASAACILPVGYRRNMTQWDGGSLYNRCHLIGFQLTGENANEGKPDHRHPLHERRGNAAF